jgi:hypothetical protein
MPQLSDLDLRILDLLSHHRVLTQNQLAAINPKTPARTLRYRCARLAENGLAGRSRPYRERGSAPFHLWPTRKGEAVVKGGPPPRGGDRSEPNPLFLCHAAGLSEIYVALERTLPDQVRIARFEREGEAREEFTVLASREKRAIAPDLFIEIEDQDGSLAAFVELDMGSMSHRRLAQKAAGYADYARAKAWQQRHPFCPALLFVTTTESRARSFLAVMRRQVGRESLLLTCACDLARELDRCAVEERWLLDDEDEGVTDLLSALMEARRPFDEWKERQAAERREEDEERERLRSDPEALADHLRQKLRYGWGSERFGPTATDALWLSIESECALNEIERRALEAIGGMLAEPLALRLAEREPTSSEREVLAALVVHHRASQVKRLEEVAKRFGEGPKLRRRRRWLEDGDLLGTDSLTGLARDAEQDRENAAEQARLRENYLRWREAQATRLGKKHGFIARHRIGRDGFLAEVDRTSLRFCSGCEEIVYPDPHREHGPARRDVAAYCHFCGSGVLKELPAEGAEPT